MVKCLVAVGAVLAPSLLSSALGFASEARRCRIAAPWLECPPFSHSVRLQASSSGGKGSSSHSTEEEFFVADQEEKNDSSVIRLNGEEEDATTTTTTTTGSWSREESARQLTEFMAKAHEEKLRAIRSVETKYRDEIHELKRRLERYENDDGAAIATTQARNSKNSYEFPATNKEMTEKIRAYQCFVSDYVVKAQQEKLRAVSVAEEKAKERYEAIISELTRQLDEFKP